MLKKTDLILALFILFSLAACGGNNTADGEGDETTINVALNDIYFGDTNDNVENPPVWTVGSNNTVTVQANNMGTLEHNWAVIEPDATLPDTITDRAEVEDVIIFDIGEVPAGAAENDVFTAPAPGQYTVICTVAGHYPLMQGRLVVEE